MNVTKREYLAGHIGYADKYNKIGNPIEILWHNYEISMQDSGCGGAYIEQMQQEFREALIWFLDFPENHQLELPDPEPIEPLETLWKRMKEIRENRLTTKKVITKGD